MKLGVIAAVVDKHTKAGTYSAAGLMLFHLYNQKEITLNALRFLMPPSVKSITIRKYHIYQDLTGKFRMLDEYGSWMDV